MESAAPPVRLFETEDEVRRVSTLQTPTGPVGVFPFLDVSVERLFATSSIVVLLHGVQDPGNVGTVIRSAHAFGAGVALSGGCADLYNPKTVRATMGSIFHVPIVRDAESVELLSTAGEAGFTTVAAVPEGGVGPENLDCRRVLLAVGAEGSGLPDEVIQACSSRVTVPSRAPSLNAAVAASILLYEGHMRVLG